MRVFPKSLCHNCEGVQYTQSKSGSVFLMCTLTERKYATQPIMICSAYQALPLIKVQVESPSGKRVLLFMRTRLSLADLEECRLHMEQSVWTRLISIDEQKCFFQNVDSSSSQIGLFQCGVSSLKKAFVPSGAFVFHEATLIEFVDKPERLQCLGWLDSTCNTLRIEHIQEILRQAIKVTFLL
jgi:hypothetical protein